MRDLNDRLPHLDALRAAAILLVLFYHFRVPGFAQGYLGVDLFLLLSGFLMTWTMLRDRARHGRFRIRAFYARRIWRILPSLLITIATVILAGYVLLSPHDLHRAVKESLYAMLFVSNIHFFLKSGYFDPAMESRPFLHTWSLSLEEQFYLFFGSLLFLGNRGIDFGRLLRILFAVALLLALLLTGLRLFTLPAADVAEAIDRAAFFLLPFRFHLLLGGALVGWWAWHTMRGNTAGVLWQVCVSRERSRLILALAGLGAATSLALPPTMAGLLVLATWLPLLPGGRLLSRLGAMRPVRWLARISYQVYLVHWPLLVLFRLVAYREPTAPEAAGLLLLSLAFGWMLWKAVTVFRTETEGPAQPLKRMAALLAGILAMQSVALADRGAYWRLSAERMHPTSRQLRDMQDAFCQHVNFARMIRCARLSGGMATGSIEAKADVILVGDSFTDHLVPGLARLFPNLGILAFGHNACPPQIGISRHGTKKATLWKRLSLCRQANVTLHTRLATLAPARIILTFRLPAGFDRQTSERLDRLLVQEAVVLTRWLEQKGHRVLWISPLPVPGLHVPSCLSAPAWISDAVLARRCRFSEAHVQRAVAFEKRLLQALPMHVVATSHALCPGLGARGEHACMMRTPNGRLVFRDESHLTPSGSVLLVSRLKPALEKFLGIRAASVSLSATP